MFRWNKDMIRFLQDASEFCDYHGNLAARIMQELPDGDICDAGCGLGYLSLALSPYCHETCTRGQIITMLWRAAGSPATLVKCPFTDVAKNSYCYNAVCWGYSRGIVKGFSADKFCPDETCTRGQIVTFIYRFAGSPLVAGNNSFADVSPDSYCFRAVCWASRRGIVMGYDANHFVPEVGCTRAQAVTFIYRLMA